MTRTSSRVASTRRPQALAARLADFARQLRVLTQAALADASACAQLADLYRQARAEISSDLTHEDFADLLAQVLVYCYLRVRGISQERRETFPLALRAFLALPGLPSFVCQLLATSWQRAEEGQDELARHLRELAAFLMETDIQALLAILRPVSLQGDPLVYFYEIFLSAYAPHQRRQRGVYYTPAPVIGYMVRVIDELLRATFACPAGLVGALQDEKREGGVFLCDPACGTGAFLWTVLAVRARGVSSDGAGD